LYAYGSHRELSTLSKRLIVLGVLNAFLAVLLAAAVNYATDQLPDMLVRHRDWAWGLVAVFGIASSVCAVFLLTAQGSASHKIEQASSQSNGIHVGRDLRVRGHRILLAGRDLNSRHDESHSDD
jgi:hypothetical protein